MNGKALKKVAWEARLVVGVSVLVCGVGGSALAGEWKLTDSFSTSLSVVDRSGRSSSSGTVLQVSPRLTLRGTGARVKASINYGLTGTMGSGGTDPENLTHDLVATGQVDAIENLLNIGVQAGARLTGNSATSGTVDSINAKSDGTQTYSFRVSPVLNSRINRFATLVSRNSVDYVDNGGGSNSGSRSMSLNLGLVSGPEFGPLSWDTAVDQRRTWYDDRTDKNTNFSVGLGYQIDRMWNINANAGWEKNDVSTNRNDTDGLTWDVGTVWTPNSRTSLSANYGQRYFGNTFSGRLTRTSKKTNMSLDLSRSVTNRRASRLVDSFFLLVDETGAPILDPDTNSFITINLPQLQETDEDFLSTSLRGAIAVKGKRSSLMVSGNIANRKYEVTGGDEDSYGLNARLSRQLSANLSAAVNAGLSHAEGTNGGDSDTYDLSFSLSRPLSRRSSVSLDLLHREHDASAANSSYTENRIGVSFSTQFL